MNNNRWRRDRRPLSIAHRGHTTEFPENTLEAYRRAIELGVEMVECDVNITRDGTLVMMHDWTLDRMTSGTGRVKDATWDEIQRLDVGGKFKPEFAGTRVPSTEEAIHLFREAGILGCFEVKGGSVGAAKQIASALSDLFVRLKAAETNFISSYYHDALALAKAKVPGLMIAPERLPDDAPANPTEALQQAQALGAPVLQHQYTVLSPEVMRALHENDVAVWSWNTDNEQSLEYSIEIGADAVMGDDVRLMRQVLNRMRPEQPPVSVQ